MENISYNPFTNRAMIKNENEFVGRIREIDDIIPRIKNGNPVSIVGERRIGKSSLLYHLFLTGNRRVGDNEKQEYKFIYLDFHNPLLKSPEYFVSTIFQKLKLPYTNQVKKEPIIGLAEGLEKYRSRNILPVLLFDEFEEITKRKELFNDDFIESLR